MGSGYSGGSNLSSDCTSFEAGPTGTVARWGDSFEVSMGNWKEGNNDVWGVEYKKGDKHRCGFQLKASRDKNGVESIHFGLSDSAENKTEFGLNITRDNGPGGLHGGITGIESKSGAPRSFTRAKQDYSIDTTIVRYGCSQREGLFVLEMKKKVVNSDDNAYYIVTLAHYYVTKDVGLSVVAKIRRNNKGNGFVVEVEGPFKHPSSDLRKVIDQTCRKGAWKPAACSHCDGAKGINSASQSGVSSSILKEKSASEKKIGQLVNHPLFSSNVREQINTGLINSSGYTSGNLNNSIIFMHCSF